MNHMFFNCSSLITLDLSNFNTKNVNNMKNIFLNINTNCKIDTKDNILLKMINGNCSLF